MVKIRKCLHLIDCPIFLLISTCEFDAQNTPNQLNTSPTYFEGPQDRKIGFRDPGPENTIQLMLNYVHHQCINICYFYVFFVFLAWPLANHRTEVTETLARLLQVCHAEEPSCSGEAGETWRRWLSCTGNSLRLEGFKVTTMYFTIIWGGLQVQAEKNLGG